MICIYSGIFSERNLLKSVLNSNLKIMRNICLQKHLYQHTHWIIERLVLWKLIHTLLFRLGKYFGLSRRQKKRILSLPYKILAHAITNGLFISYNKNEITFLRGASWVDLSWFRVDLNWVKLSSVKVSRVELSWFELNCAELSWDELNWI